MALAGILIVVASGLYFGIPVYRKQMAIWNIERVGWVVDMTKAGPDWLRSVLGDERMKLFGNGQCVSLCDGRPADLGMPHLAGIPHLQMLNLSRSQVSDAGLAHVTGLTDLKLLSSSTGSHQRCGGGPHSGVVEPDGTLS